jgi:hypothetical protein
VKDQLLEIDVRLLILRHGRQRVLEAIARLGEQTVEEIERQLQILKRKSKPIRTEKLGLIDMVASECRERPEIEEPLRALVLKFKNRTFLPHLRDVRRFLEPLGVSTAALTSSREAAGPTLVRALSKLSREELSTLANESQASGESDYSLLARAIMQPRGTKQRDRE